MIFSGCTSTETYTSPPPQVDKSKIPWHVAIPLHQAQALSPEEAKAILVARAALEKGSRDANGAAPDFYQFNPSRTEDGGWSVFVGFVAFYDGGKAYPGAGYFCVVYLDKNWTVTKIVGGA